MALLGPILGAVADNRNHKKPLFTFFLMMGVLGLAALGLSGSYLAFLVIFVIAKVGLGGSLIFYDSMLVDVTTDERMDEISSHGYAWGYIGSCVPFIASLLLVLNAGSIGMTSGTATMIAFFINAVWWGAVTLPLLKNYEQKFYVESKKGTIKSAFERLSGIWNEMKQDKKVFLFLLSFFFYIDGVYTIIEMATSYGKDVGISDTNLLLALLFTQFVAFPCSILFGKLTRRFETKNLILVCIAAYFGVAVYAIWLDTAWKFWLMATIVGVFQGLSLIHISEPTRP